MRGWIAGLGLGPREHVAIVGGGGKTSLCFALARELMDAGKRVITTTTTKVWRKEADGAPCVIFCPSGSPDLKRLQEGLGEKGYVFVANRPLDSGKVEGIGPETADALFQNLDMDYVIAEADGAAGRPVKAPAAHEPVIASSVTLVIAMMGLEAVGMPVDSEMVFRPELFSAITGLAEGETITPAALARIFLAPNGLFKGTPNSARRVVFLNKCDRLTPGQNPDELTECLVQDPDASIERVVIGSLLKSVYKVRMGRG